MDNGREVEGKKKEKGPYQEKINHNAKQQYDKLITVNNIDSYDLAAPVHYLHSELPGYKLFSSSCRCKIC